jgi:hypothetical protein
MALPDFYNATHPLVLPIGGKSYTIPFVNAADGALIVLASAGDPEATAKVDALTDAQTREMMLGSVLDEMLADGVPYEAMQLAVRCANIRFHHGVAAAEELWATGSIPEALAALMQEVMRAAQAMDQETGLISTDGANTTARRASGPGTRSHRKSKQNTVRKRPAPRATSGFSTSSDSGDSSSTTSAPLPE